MRRAQKQFDYFCKSLSISDWLPTETLRLILGCPTAKWAVSDARNALISCPGLEVNYIITFINNTCTLKIEYK